MSRTGSSAAQRRTGVRTAATARPTATPTTIARRKSPPAPRTVALPARATSAVRRVTSAVASLNRLSPSRMVTIRRGMPTRRATAVAATASGGATTAPSASAAGTARLGEQPDGDGRDRQRRDEDQPDRQRQDRAHVAAHVDERRPDGRGVEQGRQEPRERELRRQRVRRHARDERQADADGGQDEGRGVPVARADAGDGRRREQQGDDRQLSGHAGSLARPRLPRARRP